MDSMEQHSQIAHLIRQAMNHLPVLRHDPSQGIPLQVPGFGPDEVLEALDAMMSTYVTMGRRVQRFERAWAEYCGTRHAIMVNSGSSANLLAFQALVAAGDLRPGDEVLVPAVAWSTSLFPVAQSGLVPVLVDVHPANICIDPGAARRAITSRTRALLAVHLLGCPADMGELRKLGLLLVEDACGAHGARAGQSPVGSMGVAGTFSFFFSHHITTAEGGILVTDRDDLADICRSIRAHGWIREMSTAREIARTHPDLDSRFLFLHPGYNLRPTEMAAAFGLHQLERLPGFLETRRRNHREWCRRLSGSGLPLQVFPEPEGMLHAGFSFPMLLSPHAPYARSELLAFLEGRNIATRPISGGNLARQPVAQLVPGLRVPASLPVADAIHDRGFFVGNSHAFGSAHGDLLIDTLEEFHNEHR